MDEIDFLVSEIVGYTSDTWRRLSEEQLRTVIDLVELSELPEAD